MVTRSSTANALVFGTTGAELAEGIVALAMQSRDAKVVADGADIRAAVGAGM